MPSPLSMNDEPIRLPAWVSALLVTFLPVLIAVLLEQDWRVALAAALTGLIPATGIVAHSASRNAQERQAWDLAVLQADVDQAAAQEAWAAYEAKAGAETSPSIGGNPVPLGDDGEPIDLHYVTDTDA